MATCCPVAGGRMPLWPRPTCMRSALHMRRGQLTRPALRISAAQQTSDRQAAITRQTAAPVQAPRPPVQQTALALQRRATPRRQNFSILRSLIMEKQVITRQEGKSLGFVEQLYVLPQQLAVVNINLKNDALPLTPPTRNIPLAALQQIGDVLLVQNEQVTRQPDPYPAQSATKLVGLQVERENGKVLGKVRDFSFDPDTGRLESIKFDRFGQPQVPASIVSVFSVPIADVTRVSFNRVKVADRHQLVQESHGLLDKASAALFSMGDGDTQVNDDRGVYAWMEWEREMKEYRRYHGMEPFTGVTAASQRQLPPPQTQSFQDRLAPQPTVQQLSTQSPQVQQAARQQQVYVSEAAPSRDPRSRRQAAVPASMPSAQTYQPQARAMLGQGQQQPSRTSGGWRADDPRPNAASAQRQPEGRVLRGRPGNMEARQAIADARRERLLAPDARQQDIQRSLGNQQQQPIAQQAQGGNVQDAGRAWLEFEKNPVGRL